VVDLDSRNGTFVAGERIHEAPLRPGLKVRFGKTEAELRAGAKPEEEKGLAQGDSTIIRYLSDLVPPQEVTTPPQDAAQAGARPKTPRKVPSGVTASGRRLIQVVNEIGRISTAGMPLDETLRIILRTLSGSVAAERASVLLLDERGEMVPHATEPPGADPAISATVVQAAIRSRAGILTFDAQQDSRFAKSNSVIAQGIRSCMCAPIWAENRILGALVFDRHIVEPSTGGDLELATVAAYQLALAVERERFLEHSRTAEQQRRRLLRHFSPDVAAAILQQEEQAEDPLAVQVLEGVTVLFSDVRGFTRMTEHLPALELAELLREYFHQMTLAVFEERGTLDKFIGDGLMAVFDAPVRHGDGALRAVRCAWLMQGRLQALNQRLPADRRIAIRVGVNTGRVIAGNLGSPERLEYTVLGDAVNVASRLESIAEPGTAFVGRATYDDTRHAFRYRELGPRQVRGREEAVEAFQLLGPAV